MAEYTKGFKEEIPDKKPVALPVGFERPEPLESMIARLIRVESVRAGQQGLETFEEADDFDLDDEEGNLVSQYQMTDMQEDYVNTKPREQRKAPRGDTKTTEKEQKAVVVEESNQKDVKDKVSTVTT